MSSIMHGFVRVYTFDQIPIFGTLSYPLSGNTIAGYSNGTSGTALEALNNPWGLAINTNDTLYISDCGNSRVIRILAGFFNGSMVAGTGSSGSGNANLGCPAELKIDNHSNIYVDDNSHCRVMLWRNNASFGVLVAGTGICNNTVGTVGDSIGLALDSKGNLYVSDKDNHRIMKWPANATVGILVAGTTGVPGSSNQLLNSPYGLYLNEPNSYLYIVDSGNNRIQRWSSGASSGVTVVGVSGVTGVDPTMLNSPVNVIMNINGTFLYVSDRGNNRVQRYQLV